MEDAQRCLTDLRECLEEYDLTINHKKTKIVQLPVSSQADWVREINFLSTYISRKFITYSQVQHYLDRMIDLMHRHDQNAAVLNYGIKVLAKKSFENERTKNYYIKTILHYAEIYPYLVPSLEKYVFFPHNAGRA